MQQFLPTHGFRFLSKDEITALRLEDLSDDDEDGYMYEVDLHYPTGLHNSHDDYPLAPESLVINRATAQTHHAYIHKSKRYLLQSLHGHFSGSHDLILCLKMLDDFGS